MKNLFEISTDYLELFDKIEENQGEITPEIETALAINEGEVKQKGVAYCAVIKTIDGEVAMIDNEIKRLQALKKARVNIVLNLKDRLKNALILFGIDEIKTELIKINFRKSKSIVVTDVDELPVSCKTTTVTTVADKKAIKELIENGFDVKGATQVENKNIQIK